MKSLEEALQEQQTNGHFTTTIELTVDNLNELDFGGRSVVGFVIDELDGVARVEIDEAKIVRIAGVENGRVQLVVEARLSGDTVTENNNDDPDDTGDDDDPDDTGDDDTDDDTRYPAIPHCTCGAIVADDQRRPHLTSHGLTVATMTDAQIDACFTT